MDLLKNSIKECFDYCFNEHVSLNNEKTPFSVFMDSFPPDYEHYFPLHVSWKLTSECNLRCKHCFYYGEQEKFFNATNDLTREEAFELARYFVEELNILSVSFTGGEVFLCPYFIDLVEFFKSKNICISILTNATLITEELAAKLSSLLNPKYDSIQVSLDGACADTHNKIRGQGTFEKAYNGLNFLQKYNISSAISSTITSLNVNELEKYALLCKKLSVKKLNLNRYKLFSKEQEYLVPDLNDLFINFAKLIKKIQNVRIKPGFFQAYDFLNYDWGRELFELYNPKTKYMKNKLCHNHNRFHMTADGKIYLCPSAECLGLCLGDLRKDDFETIWNRRFENPLFQKRNSCGDCKYEKWCSGGCAVMSYMTSGSIFAPPPDCKEKNG